MGCAVVGLAILPDTVVPMRSSAAAAVLMFESRCGITETIWTEAARAMLTINHVPSARFVKRPPLRRIGANLSSVWVRHEGAVLAEHISQGRLRLS